MGEFGSDTSASNDVPQPHSVNRPETRVESRSETRPAADADRRGAANAPDQTRLTDARDARDVRAPVDGVQPSRLLDEGQEDLDPARLGTDVPDLHPDRFTPPTEDQRAELSRLRAEGASPEHWNPAINPGFDEARQNGEAGRTENCVECARRVQDTWAGHPEVASAIDERGLPLSPPDLSLSEQQSLRTSGEEREYTENWAGRRAEPATWDQIQARLDRDQGSAIVFGRTDGGAGHAFNAIHDRGTTKLVDGQVNCVEAWENSGYQTAYRHLHVIYFPRPGGPR